MHTLTVPDFFQEVTEPALRARVQWLEEELGLDTPFFTGALGIDPATFRRWKEQEGDLPEALQLRVRELWETMSHLLSFVNFRTDRVRQMLAHIPPVEPRAATVPWAGSSLRSYLQSHGPSVIDEVNRWVTSFRFGAPSLAPEGEVPCPLTRD